jgi:tetratricopeptide (TPR) repeat protein
VVELITAAVGKPPAALNDAISRNPGKAESYRDRGWWLAEHGQFESAIKDFSDAYRHAANPADGMALGLLLAQADDRERHREHCQAMLKHWAPSYSSCSTNESLVPLLILSDNKADANQLNRMVETVLSDKQSDLYGWYVFTKALHDYRNGRHAEALSTCRERSLRVKETRFQPQVLMFLYQVLEAMALHRTGDKEGAKRALDAVKSMIESRIAGLDTDWWLDWTSAKILYREAKLLIEGK